MSPAYQPQNAAATALSLAEAVMVTRGAPDASVGASSPPGPKRYWNSKAPSSRRIRSSGVKPVASGGGAAGLPPGAWVIAVTSARAPKLCPIMTRRGCLAPGPRPLALRRVVARHEDAVEHEVAHHVGPEIVRVTALEREAD